MALQTRRRAAVAGNAGRAPATRSGGAGRGRVAAARGAWAVGSVMVTIARIVRLLVGIIVAIIVAAILLRVFGANPTNTIVRDIHDVGNTLVGPFKNLFTIKNAKAAMAVNWGLAALAWLIVGGFVASLIARMAPSGARPGEPV